MPVSMNPTDGRVLREYPETPATEIDRIAEGAHGAFLSWRRQPFSERSRVLRGVASILKDERQRLAELMALEMGKPVRQGRAEVDKCAWVAEFYAEHAERFLQPELVVTDAAESYVVLQPLGVVLAIMPWNFPFWQVFRFAAPALMAGNAGLLKHASNVSGCALAIEDLFVRAGLPSGLFRTLLVPGSRVGALIAHPRVAAVTLTGSTQAGREVGAAAGRALKKSVLELGGSDPYLILDDADLDKAAGICAEGRLVNSGQSCIAAKRFVVVESVRKAFVDRFVAAMERKVMGDPLLERTDVGPQARRDLRDELDEQVRRSVAAGARLVLGGGVPEGPGAYYPPTVLVDVRPGTPAYDEEIFGPVAAVITARDEADAVRIANDSVFGLGAAVLTEDRARGKRLAETALEAGSCFVNAFVRSDPRLPFGGIKESGYGRELSAFGIREFVNVKTVYVA
ncbi:MAG TPA: NAD-dependent succinate-semialdehyde dehydrogenase [Candidatus Eisenbacteria bacterium]|nr:NAD-dependent succinate-semialdehyde dehydrogenase [Candidatus Eisenbacteria bacterium]